MKKINSVLISVFDKTNLEPLIGILKENDVKIYSTGGTQNFIENLGVEVTPIESLTNYPSILGGRVKTLHPKVFGGILNRRDNENDILETTKYEIPSIDMVVVDLYPFQKTCENELSTHEDIIEKIDIGGISLIRASAKNYKDVIIVSSQNQYQRVFDILSSQSCCTTEEQRFVFAKEAFNETSNYDRNIFNYFIIKNMLTEYEQNQ